MITVMGVSNNDFLRRTLSLDDSFKYNFLKYKNLNNSDSPNNENEQVFGEYVRTQIDKSDDLESVFY